MTKMEYANQVKSILEDLEVGSVEIKEIEKYGKSEVALLVQKKDSPVKPTFYVDPNKPIAEFVSFITSHEIPDVDNDLLNEMISEEYILKYVYPYLLNKELASNMNAVKTDLGNGLVEIYKISTNNLIEDSAITITDDILNKAGIRKEELVESAKINNNSNVNDISISTLVSFIGLPSEMFDTLPILIITNQKKYYGASKILTKVVEYKLHEIYESFVIIPSSIHEVMALPSDMVCDLRKIISEVNSTVLKPNEILSDDVFTLHDGVLSIA